MATTAADVMGPRRATPTAKTRQAGDAAEDRSSKGIRVLMPTLCVERELAGFHHQSSNWQPRV